MTDAELTERLKALARAYNPLADNNRFAMDDTVKRILQLMAKFPPDEYAAIYAAVWPERSPHEAVAV